MLLKSLELTNVCQHAKLDLKFAPGITGIVGPNGCGKSNSVNMLQASLTGDFGINPGKKEDNIRHDAPPDAPSRIITEWEHEGLPFTITRSLRPNSQKLEIGDKKLTRANEISDELNRLLGIDKNVIENFVFVPQWSVYQILVSDAVERQKVFAKFCGVDRAEQIWALLGKQISADQSLAVVVDDNRKDLKARMREQQSIAAAARAELAELETGILTTEDRRELEQVIKKWDRRKVLCKKEVELKADLKAKQEELLPLDSVQVSLEAQYEACKYELDNELRPTYQQTKELFEEQAKVLKQQTRRTQLEAILKLPAPTVIDEPHGYVPSRAIAAKLKDLRLQSEKLTERLEVFEQEGLLECPTCGTKVADLADGLAHWEAESKQLKAEIEEQTKAYRIANGYESHLEDYQEAKRTHDQKMLKAKTELSGIPDPPNPEDLISQADMTGVQKLLNDGVAEVDKLARQVSQNSNAISRIAGAIEAIQKQLEDIAAEFENLEVSREDYEEATERLDLHNQVTELVGQHRGELIAAERLIASYKGDIDRITSLLARSQTAHDWIADLTAWRDVFHREALPRVVTQTVLEGMVDNINRTLELFNGPYRVSVEDKLTFLAHKPRGYVEEAARLSGGEKVILGIAFRFSVAGQVGLMVLDEPTAGLDGDNIECLVDMLEHVSEVTKEKGQQVIIITHDHRLERVLDHKIELRRA